MCERERDRKIERGRVDGGHMGENEREGGSSREKGRGDRETGRAGGRDSRERERERESEITMATESH